MSDDEAECKFYDLVTTRELILEWIKDSKVTLRLNPNDYLLQKTQREEEEVGHVWLVVLANDGRYYGFPLMIWDQLKGNGVYILH